MQPGLKIDYDHVSRFQRYINAIKSSLRKQTGHRFKSEHVVGYLVADKINKADDSLGLTLEQIEKERMYTLEWASLLAEAGAQWKEFFDVLIERAPKDDRILALQNIIPESDDKNEAVELE